MKYFICSFAGDAQNFDLRSARGQLADDTNIQASISRQGADYFLILINCLRSCFEPWLIAAKQRWIFEVRRVVNCSSYTSLTGKGL